jgi:uncharacterized membrane protein
MMSKGLKPILTTLVGGLVFLIPVVVVVAVIGKGLGLTAKLAAPLAAWIPMDTVGGFAIGNLLAIITLLLICFGAGLLTRRALGRAISENVEAKLHAIYPRYTVIKGMTQSLRGDGGMDALSPVLAHFDDNAQIGFEIERTEGGLVTIFMPGSPDPWAGAVIHMTADRIEAVDGDLKMVTRSLKRLGKGCSPMLASCKLTEMVNGDA